MPNTEVKPFRADGTWLETTRESKSLPKSISAVMLCSSAAYALIAQSVEHSAVNRSVTGSSPVWGAMNKHLSVKLRCFFK